MPSSVEDEVLSNVSANVRRIRRDKGLRQVDLAKRAGVSQAAISLLEQQKAGASIGMLASISEALGVGFADLLAEPPAVDAAEAERLARIGGVEGGLGLVRLGLHLIESST